MQQSSLESLLGTMLALTIISGCAGGASYANPSATSSITDPHGQPPYVHGDTSKVKIWTTLFANNELLGMDRTGKNEIAAIDVGANGCYDPAGLKVDHSQNIWIACEAQPSIGLSLLQEYSRQGYLENSLPVQCVAFSSGYCTSVGSVSYDGSDRYNGGGHENVAVLGLTDYAATVCEPSCHSINSPGVEYWFECPPSCGQGGGGILLAAEQQSGTGIKSIWYLDLDLLSDVWFTFYGCIPSSHCGYGLGVIYDLEVNGSFRVIEPPGTYGAAGGVYVSYVGSYTTVINVVDPSVSKVYQYLLTGGPSQFSYGQAPFNVLGPIAKGQGYPVSGGFNKSRSKLVIGDARDWLDIGGVSSNAWRIAKSPSFTTPMYGAAYTPSDK